MRRGACRVRCVLRLMACADATFLVASWAVEPVRAGPRSVLCAATDCAAGGTDLGREGRCRATCCPQPAGGGAWLCAPEHVCFEKFPGSTAMACERAHDRQQCQRGGDVPRRDAPEGRWPAPPV
eukprot:jgi/Ulvmu1/11938/UM082_0017.1